MFVLNLLFLAVLATSTGQHGVLQYVQGQWIIPDGGLLYEDVDGQSLGVEESLWPDIPSEVYEQATLQEQNLPTTPDPYVLKERDEVQESAVWKIVLVAAVLLVSIVGSLSVAYYLCIWRGGRIHYQPQKQVYA